MANQQVVWIDADPSIGLPLHDCDDGFALYQALLSPDLTIAGVSVSYGNASAANAMQITQRFWQQFTDPRPALLPGAPAAGDIKNPQYHAGLAAVIEWLEKVTHPVTLIALAPATFYAGLITCRPDLKPQIKKIVWVAGRLPGERLHFGHRCSYEFHDANFEKDPAAADILLDSGIPLELVPVGLGPELLATTEDFEFIRQNGGAAGRWLIRRSRLWLLLWKSFFGLKGAPVFDCMAVLAVTHPDLIITSHCHIKSTKGKRNEFHYEISDSGFHRVCLQVLPEAHAKVFRQTSAIAT